MRRIGIWRRLGMQLWGRFSRFLILLTLLFNCCHIFRLWPIFQYVYELFDRVEEICGCLLVVGRLLNRDGRLLGQGIGGAGGCRLDVHLRISYDSLHLPPLPIFLLQAFILKTHWILAIHLHCTIDVLWVEHALIWGGGGRRRFNTVGGRHLLWAESLGGCDEFFEDDWAVVFFDLHRCGVQVLLELLDFCEEALGAHFADSLLDWITPWLTCDSLAADGELGDLISKLRRITKSPMQFESIVLLFTLISHIAAEFIKCSATSLIL